MTFGITYPEKGRGAWPKTGAGGTLTADGSALGKYYRKPKLKSGQKRPGKLAYDAIVADYATDINAYAVYKAVQGIQRWIGAPVTGMFDKYTGEHLREWQAEEGLPVDGVFGPAAARHLFEPVIIRQAELIDPGHPTLGKIAVGHCNWESGWDHGAVGGASPEDLGLFQINGPSHPSQSVDERLTPLSSIKYGVALVQGNLLAFNYDEDAGIAAYNLGKQGARNWISDGRPDVWVRTVDGVEKSTDVRRYINEIKRGAGLV